MMASDEPMSDERLAEIRARVENLTDIRGVGPHNFSDLEADQLYMIAIAYHQDAADMLAEVERLRAREAALVEVVRAVAQGEGYSSSIEFELWGDIDAEWITKQARALLAASDASTAE